MLSIDAYIDEKVDFSVHFPKRPSQEICQSAVSSTDDTDTVMAESNAAVVEAIENSSLSNVDTQGNNEAVNNSLPGVTGHLDPTGDHSNEIAQGLKELNSQTSSPPHTIKRRFLSLGCKRSRITAQKPAIRNTKVIEK